MRNIKNITKKDLTLIEHGVILNAPLDRVKVRITLFKKWLIIKGDKKPITAIDPAKPFLHLTEKAEKVRVTNFIIDGDVIGTDTLVETPDQKIPVL